MLLSAESVVITVISAGAGSTPSSASAALQGLLIGGDGGDGGRQGFTMAVGLGRGRGDGQARMAFASNGGREESLRGDGDGRRGSCLGKEVKGGSAGQVMSELRTGTSAFLPASEEHITSGRASSEKLLSFTRSSSSPCP